MAVPGPVSAALVFLHDDAQAHRAGRAHHVPHLFGVGRARGHGTDDKRALRLRLEFSHSLVKGSLVETRESRRSVLRNLDAHRFQFRRPLGHVRQHLVGDGRFLFAGIPVVVMLLRIAGVVHVVTQQADVFCAERGGQMQGERTGVVERRKAALKVKIGSAGARTVHYEHVFRYAVVFLSELAVHLQSRVVAPRITELTKFGPRQESRRVWPVHECSHANVGPLVTAIAPDGDLAFQKTPIEVLEAWTTADKPHARRVRPGVCRQKLMQESESARLRALFGRRLSVYGTRGIHPRRGNRIVFAFAGFSGASAKVSRRDDRHDVPQRPPGGDCIPPEAMHAAIGPVRRSRSGGVDWNRRSPRHIGPSRTGRPNTTRDRTRRTR